MIFVIKVNLVLRDISGTYLRCNKKISWNLLPKESWPLALANHGRAWTIIGNVSLKLGASKCNITWYWFVIQIKSSETLRNIAHTSTALLFWQTSFDYECISRTSNTGMIFVCKISRHDTLTFCKMPPDDISIIPDCGWRSMIIADGRMILLFAFSKMTNVMVLRDNGIDRISFIGNKSSPQCHRVFQTSYSCCYITGSKTRRNATHWGRDKMDDI